MTIKIIVLILMTLTAHAKTVAPLAIQEYTLGQIKLSKKDTTQARYIDEMHRMVRANKLSLKLSEKVYNITKSNTLYSNLKPWAKQVHNINRFKTAFSHMKTCRSSQSTLKRYCLNTFLKKFQKRNVITYLKRDFKLILKYSKRRVLRSHIKHYKRKAKRLLSRIYFPKKIRHKNSKKEFKKMASKILKLVDQDKDIKRNITQIIKNHDLSKFERKLIVLAKDLTQKEEYKHSRYIFKKLLNLKKSNRPSIIFEYMWTFIEEKEYGDGLDFVTSKDIFLEIVNMKDQRIDFWLAYLYEKNGYKSKAIRTYSKVINDSPLSYYAIMGSKELSRINKVDFKEAYRKNLKTGDITQKIRLSFQKDEILFLKRVKVWSKLQNLTLQSKATRLYLDNNFTNRFLKLAAIHNSEDNHLETFKATYRGINKNEILLSKTSLNFLYPYKYLKPLKRYTNSIDPFVALSLIRQESAFNRKAKSVVGARGLMQIMPKTGRSLYKRLKKKQLYNSNLNIKLGTKYLEKLLKRYDNNLVHVLSAYNAGESRVKRWKKEYFDDASIYHNIERIPFNETRKYVKLIFRNIFFYKFLEKKKEANRELASYNPNYLYDVYLGY